MDEIIIKELCARLPYGVNAKVITHKTYETDKVITFSDMSLLTIGQFADIKPYLRPMSSMTDEELKEIREMFNNDFDFKEWGLEILHKWIDGFTYLEICTLIDWLNKHHFDYQGLISKGLALKAPEGMYKIK